MTPSTKWDSKSKRLRKRLTKREKLSLLQYYEEQMRLGKDRDAILDKLARQIGVASQRQVERVLKQAEHYHQEREKHVDELAKAALAIASNLELYRDPLTFLKDPNRIGELVYGGSIGRILPAPLNSDQVVQLETVDKNTASNLLTHLREEVPELADIQYWTDLNCAKTTLALIAQIKLKAYKADYKGKCEACPK